MSETVFDWSKLPVELAFLSATAEKYGRYQFDDRILDFLEHEASSCDIEELLALRSKVKANSWLIDSWLDVHDMTRHREAALVYFTIHLLCLGGEYELL